MDSYETRWQQQTDRQTVEQNQLVLSAVLSAQFVMVFGSAAALFLAPHMGLLYNFCQPHSSNFLLQLRDAKWNQWDEVTIFFTCSETLLQAAVSKTVFLPFSLTVDGRDSERAAMKEPLVLIKYKLSPLESMTYKKKFKGAEEYQG